MRQSRGRQPKIPTLTVAPEAPHPWAHLRAWRKCAGMTLEEVGEALGTTHTSIRRWETGQSHVTAEALLRLAELYGAASIQDLTMAPPSRPTPALPPSDAQTPKNRTQISQADIARRLIAIRDEMGTTNSELARRLGVTRTRYLHWITPAESANFPAEESMAALCDLLPGLTLDFIYRGKLDALPYALAMRLQAHMEGHSGDMHHG